MSLLSLIADYRRPQTPLTRYLKLLLSNIIMPKTHYDTLDLKPGATQKNIKESFRKLARKYHPDCSSLPKEMAEEIIISVYEAYSVLGDAENRWEYDLVNGLFEDTSATSEPDIEKTKEEYVFSPTGIYDYDPKINKIVIMYEYHKIDERLIDEIINIYLSELGISEDFEEEYHAEEVFGLDVFVIDSCRLNRELELPSTLYDFEDFAEKHGISLVKLKGGVYYVESLSNFQKLDCGVEPLSETYLRIIAESQKAVESS